MSGLSKLGTARVVRPLLALAAPMLIGQAGQVALQLTDTAMLGQLGPVALAGAGLGGSLVMFSLYFAYSSVGALAPRVAQAFGAGDHAAVGVLARAGLWLAAGVGVVLGLVLAAFIPLLGHMGQPPEVVDACRPYLGFLSASMPFLMLSLALGQTVEAVNRPWPVLGWMVIAVVLNAGLNFIFIFGQFGLPGLGLAGAGLATLIARVVQTAGLMCWAGTDSGLGIFRERARTGQTLASAASLARAGVPVAGQDLLEGGSFAVGTIMLGWVGTTAMAANQVTMSIASLAWMFPIALSSATGLRVAQGVGGGDPAMARRSGFAGVAFGVGLMAVCAAIYTTSGRFLAGLFSSDPEVVHLAGTLVTIAGVYQISDAVQSISLGALRGVLDSRVPLVANAVCYWVLSLPTVYVLAFPMGWGAVGVWVGYLPWMAATGGFFLWRFIRRDWSPDGTRCQ